MTAESSSENLSACADNEGVKSIADFWNILLIDDQHTWDNACNIHGYTSDVSDGLQLLSNAKMLNEVYSYFRRFEPGVSISDTSNRLSDLVSIDQMCTRSTQISMVSDRVLFRDEPLSNEEYECTLLNALLCAHPILRYPQISRIPQARTRSTLSSTRNTLMVRELTVYGNASVSDSDESSDMRRRAPSTSHRSVDQSTLNQCKIDRSPDVRHELLSTKTLYEYVCNAFQVTSTVGEATLTIDCTTQPEHYELCTVCASPAPGNARCHEYVLEHYMPYASEKAEHARLLIRIAKEQRKLVMAMRMHAQDCEAFIRSVDSHRILERTRPQSLDSAENVEEKPTRATIISSRRGSNQDTHLTIRSLERCVDRNFKVLEGRGCSLDTHILDRAFEDSLVHTLSLSINNNKRFYFHLLHTLVAFETKCWDTERQAPTIDAGCDLFDVSFTADGAVILEESRARLLIHAHFHQVAYLGALVKCYSFTNRAFYFNHTRETLECIIRLAVTQLPRQASVERDILNNAATLLVNEMLSDVRYFLNKFVDAFTDEAHCVSWLQLFCTALRFRKHVDELSVDFNDDPQLELVRVTKQYCYERLLRLKECVAQVLSYRTTPVAVSFVRILVLRREIARLVTRGVSRAFQSVCRISLAQLLAQSYFFECLRYAETIIRHFLQQKRLQSSRACSEQLALVYLLRQLETGEWKALLTSNCHATQTEMADYVYAYNCFTQIVSELWNAALTLVLQDCGRLQMKALLRETLGFQVAHGPIRCSAPLLDCLALLLRFSHFFFTSVATLFIEPPPMLAELLSRSSNSVLSGGSSTSVVPVPLCRTRLDYLRCVSSLLLPFAFTSAFSELSEQPTARLMRTFNEHNNNNTIWKHFLAHCIDRHDLLSLVLRKRLKTNAPDADCTNKTSYTHLIKALKCARANLRLQRDSSGAVEKDFLLKFTRSLAVRLNDLHLLHYVSRDLLNSKFNRLGASISHSTVPETATCSPILGNEFLMHDVEQMESECAFCYSARLVQLTVSSTIGQLVRSCSLIITAYCSKAYTDVLNCSYLQVSHVLQTRRLETLENVEQLIDLDHSLSTVDEQLFPASFFVAELTTLCSTSFIPSNARTVMVRVFGAAVVQLRNQYRAFLQLFANPVDTCVTINFYSERMHVTYLRFSAEHLLACARRHSLTIDDETMLVLGKLLCLLELHLLNVEQLLFVWCILEDCTKPLPSQAATEVAVADRVSKVDFVKCLSTLFSLRFSGYYQIAQRFRAAAAGTANAEDTSLIRIATRVYSQYARYDLRSLDALVVLLLRRCYQQQDEMVALVHQQVQSHRLLQATRYLDSKLQCEPKHLLHQRVVTFINDLNTPSQFQDELAPYVDRLIKENATSEVPCFCWSSPVSDNNCQTTK